MGATMNLGLESLETGRQRIELDSPLQMWRPGQLIGGVIRGLGIPAREPTFRVYGCWIWDYSDLPAETWERVRPMLEKRICGLLDEGLIRWGAW